MVAARPNFMKIAPFARELVRHRETVEHILVHTGQHYDEAMSDAFFRTLGIPQPDVHLGIGSGTHAEQVGRTMMAFEPILRERRPDWVVVVGDVNATCACAITARKECVRLAHIEAGLRSFDMEMPEEINRIITDRLSDALFTTDAIADGHLKAEGVPPERIARVGNIMIDSLEEHREAAARLDPNSICARRRLPGATHPLPPLEDGRWAVLTLHRPSNVDDPATLQPLAELFAKELAAEQPLIWPLHPRCLRQLEQIGLLDRLRRTPGLVLTHPLEYDAMLRLTMGARVALTDSGGLQEECCVWGVPFVALRWNTERPITLAEHGGTGLLAGNDPQRVREAYQQACRMPRAAHRPPLWDGHTAARIVERLLAWPASGGPASERNTPFIRENKGP